MTVDTDVDTTYSTKTGGETTHASAIDDHVTPDDDTSYLLIGDDATTAALAVKLGLEDTPSEFDTLDALSMTIRLADNDDKVNTTATVQVFESDGTTALTAARNIPLTSESWITKTYTMSLPGALTKTAWDGAQVHFFINTGGAYKVTSIKFDAEFTQEHGEILRPNDDVTANFTGLWTSVDDPMTFPATTGGDTDGLVPTAASQVHVLGFENPTEQEHGWDTVAGFWVRIYAEADQPDEIPYDVRVRINSTWTSSVTLLTGDNGIAWDGVWINGPFTDEAMDDVRVEITSDDTDWADQKFHCVYIHLSGTPGTASIIPETVPFIETKRPSDILLPPNSFIICDDESGYGKVVNAAQMKEWLGPVNSQQYQAARVPFHPAAVANTVGTPSLFVDTGFTHGYRIGDHIVDDVEVGTTFILTAVLYHFGSFNSSITSGYEVDYRLRFTASVISTLTTDPGTYFHVAGAGWWAYLRAVVTVKTTGGSGSARWSFLVRWATAIDDATPAYTWETLQASGEATTLNLTGDIEVDLEYSPNEATSSAPHVNMYMIERINPHVP